MPKLAASALWYLKNKDFSVIPIKEDNSKKPYVKWEKFQEEQPDEEQLKRWWTDWPSANIGLITGKHTNLTVLDFDWQKMNPEQKQQAESTLPTVFTPIAYTPHGGEHRYFTYSPEVPHKVDVYPFVDCRNDGGYIIAPPSRIPDGEYQWYDRAKINQTQLREVPKEYINIIKEYINKYSSYIEGEATNWLHEATNGYNKIQKGKRDDTLFHIANSLSKTRLPIEEVQYILRLIGLYCCEPAFPQKEIEAKIQSALMRSAKKDLGIAEEVRQWVWATRGYFAATNMHKELQLATRLDIRAANAELQRLCKRDEIERHPNKNGIYRLRDRNVEGINFLDAEIETVNIQFPFGLENMVEIMPGNIIVVAGTPNSGKTAWLLNLIADNMDKYDIHYFNSEMGEGELAKRLRNFEDIEIENWTFNAWERSEGFADVIKPGKGVINIIDFLEIYRDFYEVGGLLAEIHSKLAGAVAIVAIQKNFNVGVGLGGMRSLEKPRLYLAMENGKMTITKAKNWKGDQNPNGKTIHFKLAKGCKFIEVDEWSIEP